ncbi:MAG TPA: LysR substrate-binding domain-containing protein, partial [Hyphomonadaceae bacterium]|nr:LysR substrate-binding domain-containing protein [Hyphomonadaceae bacterium]
RRGGGLVPTAFASEVAKQVRPALDQLRNATERFEFDPATAEREFVVAGGAYSAMVILPDVLERMRKAAPRVRLRMRRVEAHYVDDVEQNRVDMAIGVLSTSARRLEWRPLVNDEMVWVARKGHPFIRKPLSLEMLNRAGHVVIDKFADAFGEGYTEMRRFLVEAPELRDASEAAFDKTWLKGGGPAIFVTDTAQALAIVRGSDLVTLSLRRLAEAFSGGDLQLFEPPHATPTVELGLIFHRNRPRDPGFSWLLKQFEDTRQVKRR